ncbi:MAG: hypothetical protein K9M56_01825 [Victivallales bacterium]|nr:hypothetical protein [Victivallales bacterium]
MKRRKFLKILLFTVIGICFANILSLAEKYTKKTIRLIKNNKYPGRIKPINEETILKEGSWSG